MAFPQRLLAEGEVVVEELRPHWSWLGWALPAFVGSLALAVAVAVAWATAPAPVEYALLALCGLCALWLGGRWLRWRMTTLVVTTGRLIQRTGVLARRGTDIRLERVNEISYHQSIWQRLLGTGRLFVDVGGDRGVIAFEHVRHPAAVASVVHEEIVARSRGHARAPGAHPGAGTTPLASTPLATPPTRQAPSTRQAPPTRQVPSTRQAPLTGAVAPSRARASADDTPPTGTALSRHTGDSSPAQRLIELDELRRRGILSEAEFAERRARLLEQL